MTVLNERKVAEIQEYILKIEELLLKRLRNTLVFRMVQLKILCITSLECEVFFARWVQRFLLPEQMGVRVKMCNEYCRQYNDEGEIFLNRVVTCDETWIHSFEPESKQQSSVWKHPSSPSPTKALISKSAGKVMAIIFCDIQGIILNHFVPPKTTVTGNYYATVIQSELLLAIKRKHPHLERSGILLHHDKAPSHNSRIVMDTSQQTRYRLLPHPPYSPDLAICDFWLFPNLKNRLRGNKYES